LGGGGGWGGEEHECQKVETLYNEVWFELDLNMIIFSGSKKFKIEVESFFFGCLSKKCYWTFLFLQRPLLIALLARFLIFIKPIGMKGYCSHQSNILVQFGRNWVKSCVYTVLEQQLSN
jgi:hypothetical protein